MPKPLFAELDIDLSGVEIFEILKEDSVPFFLDSGLQHEEIGRYSFLGSNPFLIFKSKGKAIDIIKEDVKESISGDVFSVLKSLMKEYEIENHEAFPPFQGGVVGALSYDLGRQIENIPDINIDDLNVPDCIFGFYDKGISIDHFNNKVYIFATGLPLKGTKRHLKAVNDLNMLKDRIINYANNSDIKKNYTLHSSGELKKHFNKVEYCNVVSKAIEYIASGDIFQVNLSQRFSVEINSTPWELYKNLRKINPAPFAAFLDFGEIAIVSSSPERFLRLSGLKLETRPIKGTRPRGNNMEEDLKLRDELLNSEKDRSELVMIVDLERNDLGRVCKTGSVNVKELFRLEEYATVFHLVSIIEGELDSNVGDYITDVLKATFPGGSITGAPKIRSMEIIEELEPVKRGFYTGSLGYLGFNGESDLNIVIRTFILKDGKAYFQAGGGIVADSVPEKEYFETLYKAKALKNSLGL